MNISDDFRSRSGDEFVDASRRMRDERSALAKLYWFTAGFNMAQRIANLEYDPELLFLFTVCQTAYQQIQARVAALAAGPELGAGLPDGLFDHLHAITEKLGGAIIENSDLTPLLRRVAILGYSATGNGFYLWKRGFLSLE